MQFVTIDQARLHCKSDSADDAALTLYVNAAEKAVAKAANRSIYASQGTLDTALAGISAALTAASAAYRAALAAADALAYTEDQDFAADKAQTAWRNAQVNATNAINGIVVDDMIIAAVLLTAGDWYKNRENTTDKEMHRLPTGAERIMSHYRVIGDMA